MAETTPTVSIVVPCYNAERWVEAAVRSALAQEGVDLECIVVDDGSTDASAAVLASIEDPRLRVLTTSNQGVALARNTGIEAARGRLVAFLDADDVWCRGKLAAQVPLFEGPDAAGFVACGYAITDADLVPTTFLTHLRTRDVVRRWLLSEGPALAFASTAVVRRDLLDAAGGFDARLSNSADLDLAVRLERLAPLALVPQCLVLYRAHGAQMHRNLDGMEHDMSLLIGRLATEEGDAWASRRGIANLHTRLFVYRLSGGQRRRALGHLRTALAARPDRIVRLPLEALGRQTVRRLSDRAAQRALGDG